ncbi:unnamed protein product [Dibothriocephalus latus]|uniref:Uncharacterized protein n=1 Tax=Dibothriocephalus latus TaxID=60516 RepID=A0A3P7LRZ7_DIBLA|nr:unnamed protein product [Dibothriocephalus latus]
MTGFVIARLLAEPKDQLLSRSGRVLLVADCALQMGIRDTDGNWPISMRSLRFLLEVSGWTRLSRYMPGFVRLPCSVFSTELKTPTLAIHKAGLRDGIVGFSFVQLEALDSGVEQ